MVAQWLSPALVALASSVFFGGVAEAQYKVDTRGMSSIDARGDGGSFLNFFFFFFSLLPRRPMENLAHR
jgi:hypothetical protein